MHRSPLSLIAHHVSTTAWDLCAAGSGVGPPTLRVCPGPEPDRLTRCMSSHGWSPRMTGVLRTCCHHAVKARPPQHLVRQAQVLPQHRHALWPAQEFLLLVGSMLNDRVRQDQVVPCRHPFVGTPAVSVRVVMCVRPGDSPSADACCVEGCGPTPAFSGLYRVIALLSLPHGSGREPAFAHANVFACNHETVIAASQRKTRAGVVTLEAHPAWMESAGRQRRP